MRKENGGTDRLAMSDQRDVKGGQTIAGRDHLFEIALGASWPAEFTDVLPLLKTTGCVAHRLTLKKVPRWAMRKGTEGFEQRWCAPLSGTNCQSRFLAAGMTAPCGSSDPS